MAGTAVAVVVPCAACGYDFALAARTLREHERRGLAHVCHDCQHPSKPPSEGELAKYRRWWLARYSLDELRSWPALP